MRTFRSRIFNYKHSMPTPVVVGLSHFLQGKMTNRRRIFIA